MNQHTRIIHELTQSVKRKDKIMNTAITNASNFAQDIQIALSSLQDLSYVLWEFSDEERRDLQNSSSAKTFLARYCYQEALQKAVDDSISSIAGNMDSLLELDRAAKEAKQAHRQQNAER